MKRITAKGAAAYRRGKTAGEYGRKSSGSHSEYKRGYKFGRQEFLAWQRAQAKNAKRKKKR